MVRKTAKKHLAKLKVYPLPERIIVSKQVREGRKNWVALGKVKNGHLKQLRIVEELIACRERELIRAYFGTVRVTHGFGMARRAKHNVRRGPCILFIVSKKWVEGCPNVVVDEKNRIPDFLLTFSSGKPIAVPTDVLCGTKLSELKPQVASIIVYPPNNVPAARGVVNCIVNVAGKLYALGCRHVFGDTEFCGLGPPNLGQGISPNTQLLLVGNGPIGVVTSIVGQMYPNTKQYSLDAAFAEVIDPVALSSAMSGLNITGYAKSFDEIPTIEPVFFFGQNQNNGGIQVANHFAIQVDVFIPGTLAEGGNSFTYTFIGSDGQIWHEYLVVWSFTGVGTSLGDSGGVYLDKNGKLLGMNIIGGDMSVDSTSQSVGVMVPAWDLFDSTKYGLPRNTNISLVTTMNDNNA